MNTTLLTLTYDVEEVTFHPYRTAMVRDRFIQIDRYSDEARAFEESLAKKAGKNPDNHTAYTLKLRTWGSDKPAPKLYVMCSDHHISIGTDIEFGNW